MKTSKFLSSITASHEGILKNRAELIAEDAKRASENIVRDLEDKVLDCKRDIMNLTDLAPDTSVSLNPTNGAFDAKAWAKSLYTKKTTLEILTIELRVAQEIVTEFFTTQDEVKNK